MDDTSNRGRMEGYLRGYLDKLAYFGDSSWSRARGTTRSRGSNIFDAAYKGVGTDHRATRPSAYINKLRTQQRDLQRERDRFTPGNTVRNPYGTMSVSYGQAKNKQGEGVPLKDVPQSTIYDRAGSRWEFSPRADQIAMYGITDTGRSTPYLEAKRKELGLSDAERVLTQDQRKALMHLSNTGQMSGGIGGLLQSRGIQQVNPVAPHTLLTDEQKQAIRYLYNEDPSNDSILSLMQRHGLEASEGEQKARTKRELDAQKLSDRERNIQVSSKIDDINKYVAKNDVRKLVEDYKRLRGKAEQAHKAGRLSKDDPRVQHLAYLARAIRAKASQEKFKRRTYDRRTYDRRTDNIA